MREGGLEGIETVVQRQERVAPERDDDGLLGREYRRARLLRAGALVLDRGALLPFGHRLRVDAVTLGQHPQARLTMLDRSTHRLCRAGAPMENLAHSASFHSRERSAPSNHGIKQLGREPIQPLAFSGVSPSRLGSLTREVAMARLFWL